MTYPLIIRTLHEFNLITHEQMTEALTKYEAESEEFAALEAAFVAKWDASWRRRWFGRSSFLAWLDSDERRDWLARHS